MRKSKGSGKVAKSILQDKKECWFCHSERNLHRHHVFYGTANRRLSEKYGCWVYLCPFHHNMSNFAVHFSKVMDYDLKTACQLAFEHTYHVSREEFIRIFGRSWL